MKKYMVFAMDCYYPSGGMNDFKFSFDTVEEFDEEFEKYNYDYYHIFDTEKSETTSDMTPNQFKHWIEENIK